MKELLSTLRWDALVQARNGFYWASGFVVVVIGTLLLLLPAAARSDPAGWVPAILAVNLQITTFFFAAGLVLLERDEGTLVALAVSPLSAGAHLAARTISLTVLATIETVAVVLVGFGSIGSWPLILIGTAALGLVYTCCGVAIATRYGSLNALLLPASIFVSLLLLPLLPHFGLAPRQLFLIHPVEPALSMIRAGYGVGDYREIVFGIVGSVAWGTAAFAWGQHRLDRLMRDTRASGGR
jgi:hypothetical protein